MKVTKGALSDFSLKSENAPKASGGRDPLGSLYIARTDFKV